MLTGTDRLTWTNNILYIKYPNPKTVDPFLNFVAFKKERYLWVKQTWLTITGALIE